MLNEENGEKIELKPHLLVEVDGSIVPAEPDLSPPGHAPDGHQNLSLALAVLPNVDVVLVRGCPGLDKVHAGDVCLPVGVHDDDVVVLAPALVRTEPVRKAAVLVLAEEAVHSRDLVVGRVEEELQYVRLHQAHSLGAKARDETFQIRNLIV